MKNCDYLLVKMKGYWRLTKKVKNKTRYSQNRVKNLRVKSQSYSNEGVESMKGKKVARIARKNLMKKRIIIGHAECISQSGEARCGGAVAKEAKTSPVANL